MSEALAAPDEVAQCHVEVIAAREPGVVFAQVFVLKYHLFDKIFNVNSELPEPQPVDKFAHAAQDFERWEVA